ncbi:MAG TPA: gluconokinase [Verrucomicrobiae bacterium]|nr:gluconokinase [Verrucomicrobiae bacterium]
MNRPLTLIFMGVAGSGKTTVAKLFVERTGAVFFEGDDYHPPSNVAKMRQGIPLTDDDRAQWLHTLRELISGSIAKNELAAFTCSALKAKYREQLQGGDRRVRFVFLTGPFNLIEERLKNRGGHFMSATLLESQFAILEPPPDALTFSCERTPEEIVTELIQILDGISTEPHA